LANNQTTVLFGKGSRYEGGHRPKAPRDASRLVTFEANELNEFKLGNEVHGQTSIVVAPEQVGMSGQDKTNVVAKQASHKVRDGIKRQKMPRGAGRLIKFDANELHELVLASELVPLGRTRAISPRPQLVDSDADSTTAPSSAQQSPEVVCLVSDIDDWPSLRQAENGWDFCSEGCSSDDLWQDLPAPLVALEEDSFSDSETQSEDCTGGQPNANWWLVAEEDLRGLPTTINSNPGKEEPQRRSFADLVKDQDSFPLPPACGSMRPPSRRQAAPRRTAASTIAPQDDSFTSEQFESEWIRWHGWKKEHKASRNWKHQRKAAEGLVQDDM